MTLSQRMNTPPSPGTLPCPVPHPHPRAGRGNTWAHRETKTACRPQRGPPHPGRGAGTVPKFHPAPDKSPCQRLPSPPPARAHPQPRRLTTCSDARAPARSRGRTVAVAPPPERWERGSTLPAPPDHPSIQPEPARSPSPANFPPLTTPWTRNSKSLLFVALRAPPATSSAAIGVGSAASLTLSLSSSFFPFSAFFFLQLSPLSPAGLSHTSTRAEWGGGPFRAALTAHGPRRRRPPAAAAVAAAAAAAAAFLH